MDKKIPAIKSLLIVVNIIPILIPIGVMKEKIKILITNSFCETPDLTKEIPKVNAAAHLCKIMAKKRKKVPLVVC